MYLFPLFVLSASFLSTNVYCQGSSPMDTRKFFAELDGDMTKVTWVHRCNSRKQLEDALASDVMMIEADIIAGRLQGDESGEPIPVMGHPPETTGDISLEQFLHEVLTRKRGKGIKLDFKSTAIFKASENVLEEFLNKGDVDFPVWINADILKGPGIPPEKEVVDAKYFLETCVSKFSVATISPGWGVGVTNVEHYKYDQQHVDEMVSALSEAKVVYPVTFPVHSGLASNSVEAMTRLVHTSPDGSSLTFWAGKGEWVNYKKLRELIKAVGEDKVFIDMPPEMIDKLKEEEEPKASGMMLKAGAGGLFFIIGGLLSSLWCR